MPLRNGYAEEVIIITSGDMMTLFAAGNIRMAVENFKETNDIELARFLNRIGH